MRILLVLLVGVLTARADILVWVYPNVADQGRSYWAVACKNGVLQNSVSACYQCNINPQFMYVADSTGAPFTLYYGNTGGTGTCGGCPGAPGNCSSASANALGQQTNVGPGTCTFYYSANSFQQCTNGTGGGGNGNLTSYSAAFPGYTNRTGHAVNLGYYIKDANGNITYSWPGSFNLGPGDGVQSGTWQVPMGGQLCYGPVWSQDNPYDGPYTCISVSTNSVATIPPVLGGGYNQPPNVWTNPIGALPGQYWGGTTNLASQKDIFASGGMIVQSIDSMRSIGASFGYAQSNLLNGISGKLSNVATNGSGSGGGTGTNDGRLDYLTNLTQLVAQGNTITNLSGTLHTGYAGLYTNYLHIGDASNFFNASSDWSSTNYATSFGGSSGAGLVVGNISGGASMLSIPSPFTVGPSTFSMVPDNLLCTGFSSYVRLVAGLCALIWFARRVVSLMVEAMGSMGAANTGRVTDLEIVGTNIPGAIVFALAVVATVAMVWFFSQSLWGYVGGYLASVSPNWANVTSAIDALSYKGTGIGPIVWYFLDAFFPIGLICALIITDLALHLGAAKALFFFAGIQRVLPG